MFIFQHALVITEKPSVAQSIAAVLGAKERRDGCIVGNSYIVSWCVGHLVELAQASAYDERFGKWRLEDLPILPGCMGEQQARLATSPSKWKFTVSQGKKKQLDILCKLLIDKDIESVVCATDAGREGELIFRFVYNYCKCKKDGACLPPVERLWISSMEESAIRKGFERLKPSEEYDNLYSAALCRSQADWLVGINATRLFSCLYGATLNVGRVQTPTLALLVEREAAISAFIKEPFYTPELNCGNFTAAGKKLKDSEAAETIRIACDGKNAVIREIQKQNKTTAPPKIYDLTTLQREANRIFGYTAQQTLDYTQSLYEKKLCTYPRTDSRYLTEDMAEGIPTLVSMLAKKLSFIASDNCLPVNTAQIIDNSKVSDHHGIIPTTSVASADLDGLPVGERNILHMLAIRLLCAVGEKHVYAETVVTVNCEGQTFSAKGRTVLQNAWKEVEQTFKSSIKDKSNNEYSDTISLPELSEGEIFADVSVFVRESFSSPPKHYTEDTLLSAMVSAGHASTLAPAGASEPIWQLEAVYNTDFVREAPTKYGLGTPATRAGVIEKLVKTGDVIRKNKQLLPTDKGVNLIAIVPEEVKSPKLTAEWEHMLLDIERGKLKASDFMYGIADMTKGLVLAHPVPSEAHRGLFARPVGESVGVCPRCGCAVTEAKKGFFCSGSGCKFVLWRDNKFFTAKRKEITKPIAAALLIEGHIFIKGLYSEKTGKVYDATVVLEDTGKYINFKLEFDNKNK